MGKNLTLKGILIAALVIVAAWELYPPSKTLKPGIDLAGGTSLIYEIDAQDLAESEKRDLAQRMITVLRRRIDPANIQNLVWRPQGNTRFEIQMPLASKEAREKRRSFEEALDRLLKENISRARIMRSLKKPPQERIGDFNDFAAGDPNRLSILENLAKTYDELEQRRAERDRLVADVESAEEKISQAGIDLDQVKQNRVDWAKLDAEKMTEAVGEFLVPKDDLGLLTGYVQTYARWRKAVEELTDPNAGKEVLYDKAQKELDNLPMQDSGRARIMESLKKPPEQRVNDFNDLAQGDPNKLTILENLAKAYDAREQRQKDRDRLSALLDAVEKSMSDAGFDLDRIKQNRSDWARLDGAKLKATLVAFLAPQEKLELLSGYIQHYADWGKVVDELIDPNTGTKTLYQQAEQEVDKLNLTEEQMTLSLEMNPKSAQRREVIEELKAKFRDRVEKIDQVVAAFDEYRPFRGRLDDPKDLQRMLKGAGILEFRILPTQGHPEVDADELIRYVEALKEKGPKYASTGKYVWCEIEDIKNWGAVDDERRPAVAAPFGDKFYVLASSQKEEVMLHRTGERDWSLKKAAPGREPDTGRRAIDFVLDEAGGILFAKVSGKNIGRPLCILLDGVAISGPTLRSRIRTHGQITGSFTETEVADMVNKLNAGSLPARLIEQPISVKTIGPSIGADNRDRGIKAGLIGLVGVVCVMLVYYMLAGSIADVALLMNLLFVLGTMALLRATFTLPGIAGIILTIGMSVDANVLIFERIREEQERGSSLRIAIRNGYQRAFSTIFDANLTTFITAAILFWVASEEIKGFAIVLMLGIVSSMFTALFVTRVLFDLLLGRRIIKEHLFMLRLIRNPNVNWMASRPVFLSISAVLVAAGVVVFFSRNDVTNNKYDIEFIGGTAAVINLKQPQSRQYVEDKIQQEGRKRDNPALAAANVYSIGKSGTQYEINTTETNKTTTTLTFTDLKQRTVETVTAAIEKAQASFSSKLNNLLVTPDTNNPAKYIVTTTQANTSLVNEVLTRATHKATVSVSFPQSSQQTIKSVTRAIRDSQSESEDELGNLRVMKDVNNPARFIITTTQTKESAVKGVLKKAFGLAEISVLQVVNPDISEPRVDEVVNNAILAAFEDELEIQQDLRPNIVSQDRITEELIQSYPELADFLGGISIKCEIEKAATPEEIEARFASLRFKPDMQNLIWPDSYEILDSELNKMESNQPVNAFTYISVEEEAGFRELSGDEWAGFVDNETRKVLAATRLETSLPRVTQVDPSIGKEAKTRALIAIILSLFAIVAYIWIRFGNVRYGLAAILALVHDVCITLGAITACTYVAASPIGEMLLIGDFKINLAIIAALLTIIGYSLNDTIVVFDRIRENRRKAQLQAKTITDSINQTISRTLMTSFTTFIVVLIMYIFGGSALRGFTFAISLGVIVGTYSSIAIAAPVLLIGSKTTAGNRETKQKARSNKGRNR